MFARMYVLVLALLMVCVGSSLVCKQVACWQVARMRWQVTCVGSSLGSLAADAHVGGGRVLSLRRGALAARREDEESSLGLPCERSACVRWVMCRTRFVAEDGRRRVVLSASLGATS